MSWKEVLKGFKYGKTLESRYARLMEMVIDGPSGEIIEEVETEYAKNKGMTWNEAMDAGLFGKWENRKYIPTKEFARFALPRVQKYLRDKGLIYSRTETGSKDPFSQKVKTYSPKRKTEGRRKYYPKHTKEGEIRRWNPQTKRVDVGD